MCQLCYNDEDLVGCGCAVEKDTGLTEYGEKVISEMNRLGIVVDCAHTGHNTSLDAIAASKSPVIISHGNASSICNNKRNCEDDLIKAWINTYFPVNIGLRFSMKAVTASVRSLDGTILVLMEAT